MSHGRRRWNNSIIWIRKKRQRCYNRRTGNKRKKRLEKDIIILSDENFASSKAIKDLHLSHVVKVMSFRENGWAQLPDHQIILAVYQMARKEKEIIFLVLTRDLRFIQDCRCREQGIDIISGNLRIVTLTRRLLDPHLKNKRRRSDDFGRLSREKTLALLKEGWPVVLEKHVYN